MTLFYRYDKIVASETVSPATIFDWGNFMATIMRKMNIISRSEALYRTEKSTVGLAGVFHGYVFAICNNVGMSQEKIAKHVTMNKSTVTRHLAVLEKDGYIERKPSCEDRRELLVYPTEKMLSIYPEVSSITREWNTLLAEGISEEELLMFHSTLDKMLQKAQEIILKGGVEK